MKFCTKDCFVVGLWECYFREKQRFFTVFCFVTNFFQIMMRKNTLHGDYRTPQTHRSGKMFPAAADVSGAKRQTLMSQDIFGSSHHTDFLVQIRH